MAALREAQDFIPSGTRLEAEIDMAALVGSHRTTLLKDGAAGQVPPLVAMRRYLTFAQEQIALAGGHEVTASMALCGLGKLHATLAAQKSADVAAAEPKAVVFLQAALIVLPENHIAANELGVLLARCGDYPAAVQALEHSVAQHPTSEALANLAVLHQQIGDAQRANSLRAEAARLARAAQAGRGVQWVSPPEMSVAGGPMMAGAASGESRPAVAAAAGPERGPGGRPAAIFGLAPLVAQPGRHAIRSGANRNAERPFQAVNGSTASWKGRPTKEQRAMAQQSTILERQTVRWAAIVLTCCLIALSWGAARGRHAQFRRGRASTRAAKVAAGGALRLRPRRRPPATKSRFASASVRRRRARSARSTAASAIAAAGAAGNKCG